jgi:hypothetical protein
MMRYRTFLGPFCFVFLGACAHKVEVGEACLHSTDCETSYCLAGSCAARAAQNTTQPPVAPVAPAVDGGADAPAAPMDAAVPSDARDAVADASSDASSDAAAAP